MIVRESIVIVSAALLALGCSSQTDKPSSSKAAAAATASPAAAPAAVAAAKPAAKAPAPAKTGAAPKRKLAPLQLAGLLPVKPAKAIGVLPDGVGLAPGTVVADVALKTSEGKDTSLAALVGDGPRLVVFYRGGWCPFCNSQVREFSTSGKAFAALGVKPAFISVDAPNQAAMAQRRYEPPFDLLSDTDANALKAFKVGNVVDEDGVKGLARMGISLKRWSSRNHNMIAIPSMFLIGKDKKVLWSHADPDFKSRPRVDSVIAAVKKVLGG